MTYTIRPATSNDVPRLYDLMLELFTESAQPEQSVNRSKGLDYLYGHVEANHPWREIFVAEHDGVIVGLLKCFIAQYWYSDDKRAVHEIVYVTKGHRKTVAAVQLFQAFEHWGSINGAIFASASIYVPSPDAQIAFRTLMHAMQYQVAGTLYKKELPNVR